MTEHELKCWPVYFMAILKGLKSFEVRENDRGFEVGDVLHLREWDPVTKEYTGAGMGVSVKYILRDCPGLMPGYVVMGLHV